jgi:predicted MFS family arabinose efflux permease
MYIVLQTLTAFAAAASGPIAYTKTVSAWFARNRGIALGIAMTGIGLSAAIVPPVLARVIAARGWEYGYFTLAATALCGLIPVCALLRLPSQHADMTNRTQNAAEFATIRHSRTFWLLMAALATMSLGFAGLITHFVPMLMSFGVTPLKAGSLAGVIGVAVLGSRVLVGWAIDHIFAPYVAAFICILCIGGCALLLVYGQQSAVFAALAMGVSMGAEIDVIGFLVARYFGLRAFGRAYGWQYAGFILGAGVSPLWIGIVFDRTGSYTAPLIACIAILLCAAAMFLRLPRYTALAPVDT